MSGKRVMDLDVGIWLSIIVIVLGLIRLGNFLWTRNINPSQPIFLSYKLLKRRNDMALVYSLSCEAPVDIDVVERRLTVVTNGKVGPAAVFPKDTVDFGEFTFMQDEEVIFSLVDVDDAGNQSPPATLEFVATDTLPPAIPGGFSVSLLREVADPVPEVTPSPEVLPDPSGIEEV